MYTRCPNCSTIFRVTAAQLRLALGEVNCGSCQTNFNALNALSDELPELTDVVALEPVGDPSPDPDQEAQTGTEATGEHAAPSAEDATDINPINVQTQVETPQHVTSEADPHDDWAALLRDADEDAVDTDLDESSLPEPAEKAEGGEDETDADEDTEDELESGAPLDDEADLEAADDEDDPEAARAHDDMAPDDGDPEPDEDTENELESGAPPDDEADLEAADDEADTETPEDAGDSKAERRYDDTTPYEDEGEGEEEDVTGDEASADELEFDAPEQTWSEIFMPAELRQRPSDYVDVSHSDANATDEGEQPDFSPLTPLESQTANPEEWKSFLSELPDEDSVATGQDNTLEQPLLAPGVDDEAPADADEDEWSDIFEPGGVAAQSVDSMFAEADVVPPWTVEQNDDITRPALPDWRRLVAATLLLVALGIQLVHQNRDALAAHPVYGKNTRGLYAALGSTLYPDWNLDVYKVSGSEAVAGRTASTALDVLANVVVDGTEPVGQPMIRIVLRDRWANPVASRVFAPAEYLRDHETWPALLSPGTTLPVEISVADPGTEAQGYVVDVCLPHRTSGLRCQIQTSPFQK
jgi:predicted Zn finger-like uncharacterized protein